MLYAREFPSVKWPCLPELKLKQDELCFSRHGAWPAALCLSGDQWHWNGTTAEAQSIGCVLYCDPAGELVITLCVCVCACIWENGNPWESNHYHSCSGLWCAVKWIVRPDCSAVRVCEWFGPVSVLTTVNVALSCCLRTCWGEKLGNFLGCMSDLEQQRASRP